MGMSNVVVKRKSDGKFRKVVRRGGEPVATWHADPNQAKVYANSLGALLSAPGIRKVEENLEDRVSYIGTELLEGLEIVEVKICSVAY